MLVVQSHLAQVRPQAGVCDLAQVSFRMHWSRGVALRTLGQSQLDIQAHEADERVSHRLGLFDGEYSDDAPQHFTVEIFLVKFILEFRPGLLPALAVGWWGSVDARFVDLAQGADELSLCDLRFLRVCKNLGDLCAQRRGRTLVGNLDGMRGLAG